jgi:hypothetical protein
MTEIAIRILEDSNGSNFPFPRNTVDAMLLSSRSTEPSRAYGGAADRSSEQKVWKGPFRFWKPCNPLKSHKTAKGIFGKAWRETAQIWKSLQKSLEVLEARPAVGVAADPRRPLPLPARGREGNPRRRLYARTPPHLIGGAYCKPPCVHSAFKPRRILIGEPIPTLRSNDSP